VNITPASWRKDAIFMPLCTRCGQQAEASEELCATCSGRAPGASALDAYSGAASRARYAATGDGSPAPAGYSRAARAEHDQLDPLWYQEPDPTQFRSQQPASGSGLGQYGPVMPADNQDRQFRYEQSTAGTGPLPPFDRRYFGERAGAPPSPTGRVPEFGAPPTGESVPDWAIVPPPTRPSPDELAGGGGSSWPPPAGSGYPAEPDYPVPGRDALAGSGDLPAPSVPAAPFTPPASGRRVRGEERVSRRARAISDLRDVGPAPPGPPRSPRSGRSIAITASIAVLLIAVAVVIVLVGHRGKAGHTPQAGRGSPTASPSSAVSHGAPQSTVQGHVTVEPAVAAGPHAAAVAAFLNRYFTAINRHRYTAYERLFSPALRGGLSAAAFSSGYGTTKDSAETLHSIDVIAAGQLNALVTFTSHQQAASSPTHSSCTAWSISLYLIRQGHRYLLEAPPSGYQASYHAC
jgi:hypothetical protein